MCHICGSRVRAQKINPLSNFVIYNTYRADFWEDRYDGNIYSMCSACNICSRRVRAQKTARCSVFDRHCTIELCSRRVRAQTSAYSEICHRSSLYDRAHVWEYLYNGNVCHIFDKRVRAQKTAHHSILVYTMTIEPTFENINIMQTCGISATGEFVRQSQPATRFIMCNECQTNFWEYLCNGNIGHVCGRRVRAKQWGVGERRHVLGWWSFTHTLSLSLSL